MIHTHDLREGNKGMEVWRAQILLSEYGFPLILDGDFGPKTKAAVEAAQDKLEVPVTGVLYQEQQELLMTEALRNAEIGSPHFLPFLVGLSYLGVAEFADPGENPFIQQFLLGVGMAPDDEIPWCSAFINTCCAIAGIPGTGKATARSWLTWKAGGAVEVPLLGDLVIFSRGQRDGWQGHVAFYGGRVRTAIKAYGGNHGNQVKLSLYLEERVLGYRRAIVC